MNIKEQAEGVIKGHNKSFSKSLMFLTLIT